MLFFSFFIQGLWNGTTFVTKDLGFADGLNDFCERTLFQDDSSEPDEEDVSRFLKTLLVDPDEHEHEHHFGEFSSQRSSDVESGNLGHGFIGKLSAHPQSALRGVYGKDDGSSSDTDSDLIQVQVKV